MHTKLTTSIIKWWFIPSVLKPDFDLFRVNIRKNGTLPNELMPLQRSWLWTFCINPLQSLHLFWCIPHILATIHLLVTTKTPITKSITQTTRKTKKPFSFLFFLILFINKKWWYWFLNQQVGSLLQESLLSNSSRLLFF